MLDIKQLIKSYLEAHNLAWAPSTQRSERYRLSPLSGSLTGDPQVLWSRLVSDGTAPYSRVTTWTRVTDFWGWCIKKGYLQGPNRYEEFREENARLFKNAYTRRPASLSFEDARTKVESITERDIRESVGTLLTGGLRISEIRTLRDGRVTGKGNKTRRTMVGSPREAVSEQRIRRALKRVGLKPHDLRKIAATEAARLGANHFDLCKMFGWSSIQTATSYIDASDNRVEELFNQLKK